MIGLRVYHVSEKPRMSEDYRMSIFDAVALASTFFFKLKNKNSDKKGRNFSLILSGEFFSHLRFFN